jgi:hypothetical protein
VVVVLFAAYTLVTLAALANNLLALLADPVVLSSDGGEQLTLYDVLLFFSVLASVFVYVALVVAFLVWLHRAARNLPALGNPKSKIEHSPGWAVGSFFVPFVNLVVPYKAVREIWVKSDPAVRTEDDFMFAAPSSAPLLLGWWIAWLASNVTSNVAWRLHEEEMSNDKLRLVAGLHALAYAVTVLAAVLAVMVVRGIDRRQAERARHVTYVPHMPPPPPLFRPQPAQGPPPSTFGRR